MLSYEGAKFTLVILLEFYALSMTTIVMVVEWSEVNTQRRTREEEEKLKIEYELKMRAGEILWVKSHERVVRNSSMFEM